MPHKQDACTALCADDWLEAIEYASKALAFEPTSSTFNVAIALGGFNASMDVADVAKMLNAELTTSNAANRALAILSKIFNEDDVIELRALPVEGGAPRAYCGRWGNEAERTALIDFINQHNAKSNLYFGVNPRVEELAGKTKAAKASQVVRRQTVVLDFDFHNAPTDDPQWQAIERKIADAVPVACTVQTGNGFHLWVRIEPTDPSQNDASTADINKAMEAAGSDPIADLPRIARLPFTVNIPTSPKLKRGAKPRFVTAST